MQFYRLPPTIAPTSRLAGVCRAPILTANANDWSPDGLAGANMLLVSSDASRDVTGIAAGAPGQMLAVMNEGSQDVVLKNASGSSRAENRFALGADLTLAGGHGALLVYDPIGLVWRCVGDH